MAAVKGRTVTRLGCLSSLLPIPGRRSPSSPDPAPPLSPVPRARRPSGRHDPDSTASPRPLSAPQLPVSAPRPGPRALPGSAPQPAPLSSRPPVPAARPTHVAAAVGSRGARPCLPRRHLGAGQGGGAHCDDVTWGGPGAVASSGRWRRRAMGAEEPDVYRDTWVRYLGELRHRDRGWRRESRAGAGAGNPVATATAGTQYRRRRRHSLLCTRFRVPAPGVGSAAPRAPQLWAAPCPRCCPPVPFVRALPAAPLLAPRCPSAGTKVTPGVGVTPPP